MKPLHIGILVAIGALGGAMVMKLARHSDTSPVATSSPAQVTAPVTPAPSTSAPAAETAPPPSPFDSERDSATAAAPKHVEREARRAASKPHKSARNTEVAVNRPPQTTAVTPPAPEPASQPQVPQQTPAPAPEPEHVAPPPPPPPPPPRQVTVTAGTLLPVRLVEGLSSDRNQPGDTFSATLDAPLVVDGFVIAERGSRLEGKVVQSQQAGRVRGVSDLSLELTSLKTSDGQRVSIQTDAFEKRGETSVGKDAAKVGAAAGIGAAIGAIAGGGKGAGIGAAIGGAAGTGGVMATRGKAATIPSETRISFRLRDPVTVTEHRANR
jgi:hypothetical protein